MLELYEAYATYNEIMDLTEGVIRDVAHEVLATGQVLWEDQRIDLDPAFRRWRMDEAVRHHNPEIGAADCTDRDALARHCERLKIHVKPSYGWGKLLLEIFEKTVEHTLIQPTFITDHPVEVSPLARANDDQPGYTDRFELFINGKELANGFSELNDPEDQAARFQAQVEAKEGGDDEAMHFDADYIRALEVGLAPTGGDAADRVGFDPRRAAVPVHAPGKHRLRSLHQVTPGGRLCPGADPVVAARTRRDRGLVA
jgi:lysyl-tRNA synthetase class 2